MRSKNAEIAADSAELDALLQHVGVGVGVGGGVAPGSAAASPVSALSGFP
eukprot:EW703619.1.p4 GENE.EW703619.1~~EW703619.1.p4  ORF type:complete len:50 (+),score=14.42 EW703619.1:96-245(+)